MRLQEVYHAFVKEFYAHNQSSSKRGVGIELEIPVVDKKGQVVDISIIQGLFRFLESKGFQLKKDKLTKYIVSASRVNTESASNFDYIMDTVMTDAGSSTIEIAFAPQNNLYSMNQSIKDILDLLIDYFNTQNCQMLGYGIQPVTAPTRDLLMPKERYFFYEKFSPNRIIPKSKGADAHLLTITASNQCHVSISEKEAITAVNVLNALSGLQIILNANAPIWKGKIDAKYKAIREVFWEYCYPDRTKQMGIPPTFHSLQAYVDFLLEFKPMLVKRTKLLQILNKSTFKDFLFSRRPTYGQTLSGEIYVVKPKVEDIHYLNTFCYFNARLVPKYGTIESRMSCQQPPNATLAPTALTLGILSNLEAANQLTKSYSWQTWKKVREDALKYTFDTKINGQSIIPTLTHFLEIANQGLEKRKLGEEVFLIPLFERLKKQQSPADKAIEVFERSGITGLLEHFSFQNASTQSISQQALVTQ